MAKDNIRSYSSSAASTDVGGINLSEGVMVPSDLNNSLREIMSHLADFSAGTEGIDVLSLEDDDASAAIKFQAPATVTTTTTFTLPDGDGSSNQVLSTDGSGTLSWYTIPAAAAEMVSGMLMPFAGSSAPSGWLLCYGQAISRTTYADLFTASARLTEQVTGQPHLIFPIFVAELLLVRTIWAAHQPTGSRVKLAV